MKLNFEVNASSLQTAQLLRNYLYYGFLAEGIGALLSGMLFAWLHSQLIVGNGELIVLSDVNIVMFLLWEMFKLILRFTSAVCDESVFESKAVASGDFVSEVNLDFLADMFSESR